MKKTALYNIHRGLNAKMTQFGGYLMPVQYSSVKKEHLAVRNNLGVFDVSHMGEFFVSGANALNLLQYICSNDISKIKIIAASIILKNVKKFINANIIKVFV